MSQKRVKNDCLFPLEHLSAEALCENMPSCTAFLVFAGSAGGVHKVLKKLYRQSHERVFYTEDPLLNKIPIVLAAAEKGNIPVIVLYADNTPQAHAFLQGKQRVSLVSRGKETPGFLEDLCEKPVPEYFSWIGFQRYFTQPAFMGSLADHGMETLRLGDFREDPLAAEPLLREATHHFLDMRSVRHADLPDGICTSPNGLYSEEICTLARYMGLSRNFRMAVIYGYPASCPEGSQAAQLTAQVLWHLTEGLAVSVNEHPADNPEGFQKKAVQMGEDGQELIFFQSEKSGRWWMELPNSKYPAKPSYIACSVNEYVMACRGEIPMKWLFYYQKSNNFS
ncbi:MAG: hypothetical protein GX877_07210 [Bacteroidales bacterium]|nr:hypothetical protein [Bacteroidales bacterium]